MVEKRELSLEDVIKNILEEAKKGNVKPLEILFNSKLAEEKAPSIGEFLESKEFLGSRGKTWKYWNGALNEIFSSERIVEVVFRGAVGIGKSTAASKGTLYIICQLMCLAEPQKVLGVASHSNLEIVLFSLTESLAEAELYQTITRLSYDSPWFRKRCNFKFSSVGSERRIIVQFPKNIQIVLGSAFMQGFGGVGRQVVMAVFDELVKVSEIKKGQVINFKEKVNRAVRAYIDIARRVKSRFLSEERAMIGKLFLVAASESEDDVLSAYLKYTGSSSQVKVFAPSLWEAKGEEKYTKWCWVVWDDKDRKFVMEEEVEEFRSKGYQVLRIPELYRDDFERDFEGALAEIGGVVRKSGLRKFMPMVWKEKYYEECVDKEKKSPFVVDVVRVGLRQSDWKDEEVFKEFISYIDDGAIKRSLGGKLGYWGHCDIGVTHDAMGIALSRVSRVVKRETGTIDKEVETDLMIKIKAIEGDQIPISLARRFFIWLKEICGVDIMGVSFDSFQSMESGQLLKGSGIEVETVSVDRDVRVYMTFREIIFGRRFKTYQYAPLEEELFSLVISGSNSIDHAEGFSKDVVDSVASSAYKALQSKSVVEEGKVEDMIGLFEKRGDKEENVVDFGFGKFKM